MRALNFESQRYPLLSTLELMTSCISMAGWEMQAARWLAGPPLTPLHAAVWHEGQAAFSLSRSSESAIYHNKEGE